MQLSPLGLIDNYCSVLDTHVDVYLVAVLFTRHCATYYLYFVMTLCVSFSASFLLIRYAQSYELCGSETYSVYLFGIASFLISA